MKLLMIAFYQFLVIPVNKQDQTEGGQVLISDPEDPASSPEGWNTGSTGTSLVTDLG